MTQYVRPLLAFMGLLSWTAMILGNVSYPDEFQWMVIGMMAWWFGDRTLTKLRGK